MKTLLAFVMLLAMGAATASAGTVWHDPTERDGAELQVSLPQFETGGASAQVLGLTWRRRVNEDFTMHGDFVFSTIGSGGERGNALGNPYLGLELGKPDMLWTVEAGLRLPLVSSSPSGDEVAALFSGALTDYVVRPGAYAGEAVPIEVNFHYHGGDRRTSWGAAHLGFELWAPTGDREESERFFTYGGHVWLDTPPIRFNLGMEGRVQFDEGGDDNEIELSAGLQAETAHVRPGLNIRVPVDNLQDFVDVTIALYVGVH